MQGIRGLQGLGLLPALHGKPVGIRLHRARQSVGLTKAQAMAIAGVVRRVWGVCQSSKDRPCPQTHMHL